MNIGSLTATLGVDATGLNRAEQAMQQFRQKTEADLTSVAASFDKTGRNIYYFGTAASRFLTLPITLAGVAVTKTAKDFEFSMQKIVGLVGVSQSQVNTWSQDLLKLGPQLGKGPKELADALYFVTSSGFKSAEALDIVTQSAKASASGLGETKKIADLITSAMSAYGKSGFDAAHYMDILTASVREGKGEATDFADKIGAVIPIASQMGVAFDQIAGAVSAITLTGQNVAQAVTGVRQVLFEIEKPAATAIKVMESMGISFDDVKKSLQNKGLISTLKMLSDETKAHGQSLADIFPNIRAYAVVMSLLGDRYKDNLILQNSVTNSTGSAASAYAAISQTIEQKYNQAVASAQSAMIQFGLALKGPVISLLERFGNALRDLSEWFVSLSDTQQKFILKFAIFLALLGPATIAIGLLMRAMGGFLVVGKDIAVMLQGVSAAMTFSSIPTGNNGIILFLKALWTAMGNSPFITIGIGIASVVAAYKLWGETSDKFMVIQNNVNKQVGDSVFSLTSLFSVLKNNTTSTKERADAIKLVNDRYGSYLTNLLTEKSTLEDIEKAQKQATNALVASISIKSYREALEKEIENTSKAFSNSFGDFISGFTKTYGGDRLGEFMSRLFEGADEAIKTGNSTKIIMEIWDDFVEKMSKRTGYLKYGFEDFEKAFREFIATKGKNNAVVDQIKAIIAAYEKLMVVTKSSGGKGNGGNDNGNGSSESKKEIERVHRFVLDRLKIQNDVITKVGQGYETQVFKTFDKIAEHKIDVLPKNKLDISDLVKGSKTTSAFAIKIPKIEFDSEGIGEYAKKLMQAADASGTLQKKLADIALVTSLYSDTTDKIALKQEILKNQTQYVADNMKILTDAGFRPGNDSAHVLGLTLDQLTTIFKNLQGEIRKTKGLISDDLANAIATIGGATSNLLGEISSLMNAQKQKEIASVQEIAAEEARIREEAGIRQQAKEEKWSQEKLNKKLAETKKEYELQKQLSDQIASINEAYGKKMKALAIAQAIINTAVGVTKALATEGLLGIVQAALITAAGAVQIATIEATEMAEGGIVPAGYPNDSYPARLTSGEMVVPPGKLPNIQGQGNIEVKVIMDSVLKGTDIHYIVKEVQRKYKNSMS
jgi:TP901 family phage tail tape measure protein